MIRYDLICHEGHEFEAWFSSSTDFEAQREKGQISCLICGCVKVERAIMAPNISTSRQQDKIAAKQARQLQVVNAAADKIRRDIADNCENVGQDFAEEARAIHYGEKPARGIYGQATLDDVEALHDEGVEAMPLPDILSPDHKAKSH